MAVWKKLTVLFILVFCCAFLLLNTNSTQKIKDTANTEQTADRIESSSAKKPCEGESISLCSYSAPLVAHNTHLQRRVSYINSTFPVFVKMLLNCFSVRENILANLFLKNILNQSTIPFSEPCRYYVFALQKIVV